MAKPDHLKKLIGKKHRRLELLEEQRALKGYEVDPSVVMEINDIHDEIEALQLELQALVAPPVQETVLSDAVQIAFDHFFEEGRQHLLVLWPEARQEGASAQLAALRRAFLVTPPDLKTIEITLKFFKDNPAAARQLRVFLQAPLLQKLIRRSNDEALRQAYEQLAFSQSEAEING